MMKNNLIAFNQDHISVCICTFKRPEMLDRALKGVASQVTESLFSYDVVVVDNDLLASAKDIARKFQDIGSPKIFFDCEPEQNISLARNRTIRNATGNLIAFIDDDEFPDGHWLLNHYKMVKATKADGVLGPVIPHFAKETPPWIIKSKLWERNREKSGTKIIGSVNTRTGNVLLSKKVFEGDQEPFDPRYGRTGGGDADFFRRKMEKGFVFVWCDEAIVYETVPPERQKRSYLIRRAFTRGMTSAWSESFFSMSTLRSLVAVGLYTLALPIFLLLGHHLFMKYLVKDCDHISKLLAYGKINFVKKRPY